MKSGEELAVKNLDGMAEMEAKLQFANNEKNEINQELEYVRSNKNTQIQELKDELQEMRLKYNEAHQAQMQIEVYEKKMGDLKWSQMRIKALE